MSGELFEYEIDGCLLSTKGVQLPRLDGDCWVPYYQLECD